MKTTESKPGVEENLISKLCEVQEYVYKEMHGQLWKRIKSCKEPYFTLIKWYGSNIGQIFN